MVFMENVTFESKGKTYYTKVELKCYICGKPTRSHKLDDGKYVCHGCWGKHNDKMVKD